MNLVFKWSDGTAFDYELWADGEPNNQGSAEDCVEISMETEDKGEWDDIHCIDHHFGYVCKYSNGAAGNFIRFFPDSRIVTPFNTR